jgi:hypothetical protein
MVIGAVWAAWRLWRTPSVTSFGIVVAAAAFLPVANLLFPTGIVLAERTLYAPSIGIALAIGAAASVIGTRWPAAPVAVLGVWAGVAGSLTAREAERWHDSRRVFETMTQRNPSSYLGWWYLGMERTREGDSRGGLDAFAQSIADFDADPRVLFAGAQRAIVVGDTTRALLWLDRAIDVSPADRRARAARINLALVRGDTTRARRLLDDGLAREPDQRIWQQQRARLAPR